MFQNEFICTIKKMFTHLIDQYYVICTQENCRINMFLLEDVLPRPNRQFDHYTTIYRSKKYKTKYAYIKKREERH